MRFYIISKGNIHFTPNYIFNNLSVEYTNGTIVILLYTLLISTIIIIIIIIILSFQIRTGFFLSICSPWRHEERNTNHNANHTMLTPPQRAVHLVMFKISTHLCRSRPKLIWSYQIRKTQMLPSTLIFSKSSNFGDISSEYDITQPLNSLKRRV